MNLKNLSKVAKNHIALVLFFAVLCSLLIPSGAMARLPEVTSIGNATDRTESKLPGVTAAGKAADRTEGKLHEVTAAGSAKDRTEGKLHEVTAAGGAKDRTEGKLHEVTAAGKATPVLSNLPKVAAPGAAVPRK